MKWLKNSLILIVALMVLISGLYFSYILKEKYFFQPMYKRDPNFYFLSYTDIEQFREFVGKEAPIPYIEKAVPYPIILGFVIYSVGIFSSTDRHFFTLNSVVLIVFAVLIFFLLYKIIKEQKLSTSRLLLFWVISPSIFFYTIYNWDVVAIFLMVLSIYFFLRNKDSLGSLLLALGVATKFFPIFLLPAILLQRWKEKNTKSIKKILLIFSIVTILINVPFAVSNFFAWSFFYQHSLMRDHSLDTVWTTIFVLSDKVLGPTVPIRYSYESIISKLSLVMFIGGFIFFFRKALKSKENIFLPLSLSLFLIFLLSTRTFSAGYILWILPFIILMRTNLFFSILVDWSGALVLYVLYQYFYYGHDLKLVQSPGHWLEWLLESLFLRHFALFGLLISLWFPLKRIFPLKYLFKQ